jgi:hypothetical protein
MPLNSNMLAKEMLAAIGGKTDKKRQQAFEKLAQAIVLHIQKNGVVVFTCAAPGTPNTGIIT